MQLQTEPHALVGRVGDLSPGVTNGGTQGKSFKFRCHVLPVLLALLLFFSFSLLSPSLLRRPVQCPLVFVLTTIKLFFFFLLFSLSFFLLSIKLFVYGQGKSLAVILE